MQAAQSLRAAAPGARAGRALASRGGRSLGGSEEQRGARRGGCQPSRSLERPVLVEKGGDPAAEGHVGQRGGRQACPGLRAGHRPGHDFGQGGPGGGGRARAGGGRELLQADAGTHQQPGSWSTGKGWPIALTAVSGLAVSWLGCVAKLRRLQWLSWIVFVLRMMEMVAACIWASESRIEMLFVYCSRKSSKAACFKKDPGFEKVQRTSKTLLPGCRLAFDACSQASAATCQLEGDFTL